MTKKQTAFRIDPEVIDKLKQIAKEDNRSLNNYVELLLIKHIKQKMERYQFEN